MSQEHESGGSARALEVGGFVWLMGAGIHPDDADTPENRRIMGEADVVLYDEHARASRLRGWVRAGARQIHVGKLCGERCSSTQADINRALVDFARAGLRVVRLKGGDPGIFSRGAEECAALASAGVGFAVRSSITAATAAAAESGVVLTERGISQGLLLLTGHGEASVVLPTLDWGLFLSRFTCCFYMGLSNWEAISAGLMAGGATGEVAAAAVSCAGGPGSRWVFSTISGLGAAARGAGLVSPTVIFVGAGALAGGRRGRVPGRLAGVSLLWPVVGDEGSGSGVEAGMGGRLRSAGVQVLEVEVCRSEVVACWPDALACRADCSWAEWVCFTSRRGVDAFFSVLMGLGLDGRVLGGCRLGAVGAGTADRLGRYGLVADVVGGGTWGPGGAGLARALGAAGVGRGSRVLGLQAESASGGLAAGLEGLGAVLRGRGVYRLVDREVLADWDMARLRRASVGGAGLTSGRLAGGLFRLLGGAGLTGVLEGAVLGCLGPSSAVATRRAGLEPSFVLDEARMELLETALLEGLMKRGGAQGAGVSV